MKSLSHSLTRLPHPSKKSVVLIVAVGAATILISATISIWLSTFDNLHIPSIGTIRAIGVKPYWDAALTNETKEIQWGATYPGYSYNVTLYLQSESTVNSVLGLTTANWTFLNSTDMVVSGPMDSTQYMNLTWDYNNATLSPAETRKVSLTLNLSDSSDFVSFLISNNVKSFSFDISIRALEEH